MIIFLFILLFVGIMIIGMFAMDYYYEEYHNIKFDIVFTQNMYFVRATCFTRNGRVDHLYARGIAQYAPFHRQDWERDYRNANAMFSLETAQKALANIKRVNDKTEPQFEVIK
jgi:hypothetical protein